MAFVIEGGGLHTVEKLLLEQFPNAITRARTISLNDTARFALKRGAEEMRRQLRFPAGYLDDPKRFLISRFASDNSPTAIVSGRLRATSLARFAAPGQTPESTGFQPRTAAIDQPGTIVNVGNKGPKRMRSAFLIRLKRGKSFDQDNFNLGIAVRIKNGQAPTYLNKYKFEVGRDSSLYVLYGPSVAQAFDIVAPSIAQEITSKLDYEFQRQLNVQLGKA